MIVGQFQISPVAPKRGTCHALNVPKRTSKPKLDTVQKAYRVVMESIEESEAVNLTLVSRVMSQMGRKGGKIGGKRRLETMTDAERTAIARKAAKARWAKRRKAS